MPSMVVMVRPLVPADARLTRWCEPIRRLVRPVDRVALYGPVTV